MRWIFVVLINLLCVSLALTQRDSIPRGEGRGGLLGGRRPLPKAVEKDSFELAYFHAQNLAQSYKLKDTLLKDFHQYNPARLLAVDAQTLGSLGNPAQDIFPSAAPKLGFRMGFNQFDLYRLKADSIRFYRVNRTYSDLSYAQGPTQEDFIFEAVFTRNITKQFNLALDYQRISHAGFYTRQKSRHTHLAINGFYESKSKRYQLLLTYLYNDMRQQDNGGITTDSLFSNSLFATRENIPVALSNAVTYDERTQFSAQQYLALTRQEGNAAKRQFTLGHKIGFQVGTYRFSDEQPDSSYYLNLYTSDRGLRQFWDNWELENEVTLNTFKLKGKANTYREAKDRFNVGLRHTYYSFYQEPIQQNFNSLYLTADLAVTPSEKFELKSEAFLGLLDNTGDYYINGTLSTAWNKIGRLSVALSNQRHTPSLLSQRAYLTSELLWENNLEKPIETSLKAAYQNPFLGLTVTANYLLLNNYIYYDEARTVQQISASANMLQFIVNQEIELGVFHLENTISYQISSDSRLRVPKFFGKHSAYFEGKIFKGVMLAKIGADVRYNSSYFADNYIAALGQFYIQNEEEVLFYPAVDVFLSFKVQGFRAFIKYENLTDFLTEKIYYQTPSSPMPDAHLRFGIAWRFVD